MSDASPSKHLDPLALLVARWRALFIIGAAGVALGVLYALLAPSWYQARLAVVPSQGANGDLSTRLEALPAFVGIGTGSTNNAQLVRAVLSSNSVADQVIEKFDLQAKYGVECLEDARTVLWTHCALRVDRRSTVVILTCEDKNPALAMAMTAFFGEAGNQVFGRVSSSSAREERIFLEKQLAKFREDVDEASRKLRDFQQKYKVVDLSEQSKAVISAMASIQADLISKQIELSYLRTFSSPTAASVTQLKQQAAILEAKLTELQNPDTPASPPPSPSGVRDPKEFFPEAMRVPELRHELERLVRELKTLEGITILLAQRYEMARVDEARNTSTFQVLDYPTLPSRPSRPHFRKSVLTGLVGGVAVGVCWVVLPAWWRRRLVVTG